MLICHESSDQENLHKDDQAAQKCHFKIYGFLARISSDQEVFKVRSRHQGKFSVIKNLDPGRKYAWTIHIYTLSNGAATRQ